ncbi:MAG: hypothetical protein KatS3mg061_1773 [Dehalococcoidia bacterium]|nr:MAG: hypothetical protein KatS3mg061_1773 [Dehalococcoidia bacterium]
MFGPTLRGQQVLLGQPCRDEAPTYLRWLADPEVTRFLPMRHPPSLPMEEEWLETMARSERDVVWTVRREEQLVGVVGLHLIDWLNRNCIQGVMIGERTVWHSGIASEAVGLTLGYAFLELGLEKVKGYVALPNEASLKMAIRCGYKQVGILRREWYRDGQWIDRWIGEVLRDEWLATFRSSP